MVSFRMRLTFNKNRWYTQWTNIEALLEMKIRWWWLVEDERMNEKPGIRIPQLPKHRFLEQYGRIIA